jgi:hypothetical protein
MRRQNHPKSHSTFRKISFHRRIGWFGVLALLILAVVACNLPFLVNKPLSNDNTALDQALAVTPRDDRPEILQRMGRPDAFRITFDTLNSQVVRYEEWSFFDDRTRLDFIDGTLVSTEQLELVPDGTIFASDYDPQSFYASMPVSEVKSILDGQEFVEEDTAQTGEPGGLLLVSRQILFGFDQGQLVYVETLVLTPEVAQ